MSTAFYTTRSYMIKTLLLCHFLLVIGCGYIHLWCLRARQKGLLNSGKVPTPLWIKLEINYKIQLIGGTHTFVVHRNRLKLCYTPPPNSNTGLSQPSLCSDFLPTYYPASGVGGYTSLDSTPPDARPVRNCRPPTRYTNYILH